MRVLERESTTEAAERIVPLVRERRAARAGRSPAVDLRWYSAGRVACVTGAGGPAPRVPIGLVNEWDAGRQATGSLAILSRRR